jgi:PTH2 family peptidyl-tRNA hydrolase
VDRTGSPAEEETVEDNDDEDEESGSDEEDDGKESDSEQDDPTSTNGQPLPCSSWGYQHAPYKMMLVVNQELGMGKGKIAAQCGHASVGCYKRCLRLCPKALMAWERTGCAKIAVKCPTDLEMEEVAAVALSLGIPAYMVEDAGRTQVAAGSRTVLGLFGPTFAFDGVTDHLKLM